MGVYFRTGSGGTKLPLPVPSRMALVRLAGIAAPSEEARVAAQMALADLPLEAFLHDPLVPYEADEVTRLILGSHDARAFAPIAHLTVGDEASPVKTPFRGNDPLRAGAQAATGASAAAAAGALSANDGGAMLR